MNGRRRIVVVGGVAAGMSAASQARRRDPDSRIIVFERGPAISYGACGMPYNIADTSRKLDDLVVLSPEEARTERGIDLHLNHEVTQIDLAGKQITVTDLKSGEERREAYDGLILATGARPIGLNLPGFELDGITPLRDLEDGRRLKALLDDEVRSVVVVGGGYIGMEMAHVLVERGFTVTVVDKAPQILPGWNPETVEVVQETLTTRGVKVFTSVSVQGAEEGPDGRVAGLITEEGTIEAEVILVAVGVRPNVELAAASGLRIGESGAIWVNQRQQTSNPAVWAAGDCAEAYHRILRKNSWIPLGTTANKQGRVAGANVTGSKAQFRGIVGTSGFAVFDLEVAHSGLSMEQAQAEGFEPIKVTIRQRSRAHAFPGGSAVQVTLVADGPSGMLLGGEVVGREGAALRCNVLATALAAHLNVADLQGLDLVYAPPFAPVWDPILVAANQLIKKTGRG